MDPKYFKETSTKVEPDIAKNTDTQKKYQYLQTISGIPPKNPDRTATMSTPSRQPRFLGRCEGTNGHIFDIGPTQSDRYIKMKKDLVGYVGCTY